MPSPARQSSVYTQAVRVTQEYLGPVSERFISQQVRNHLRKKPADMTAQDLADLIDWIRMATALLTDDGRVVEDYVRQLEQVAQGRRVSVGEHA